ncbi:MAG: hypothetical protein VYC91_06250 [Acidobacteriota bacterium]|nr:hypothetical protein [Acidobacteriota bacterium]
MPQCADSGSGPVSRSAFFPTPSFSEGFLCARTALLLAVLDSTSYFHEEFGGIVAWHGRLAIIAV